MKTILAALAALAIGAGAPSLSLAQQAASTPAPAPTPRALELARTYIRVMHMQENIEGAMKRLGPALLEQVMKGDPNLAVADRKLLVDMISEAEDEAYKPFLAKYLDEVAVAVAQTYTEDELQQVIGFYESPVGRSMLAKSPLLVQRASVIGIRLMPEFQQDLKARIMEKVAKIIEQKKREAKTGPA